MITGRDVRKEIRLAKEVIASKDSTAEQRLEALRKSIEVVAKVTLSTRASVVKIMEKLGVDKIAPSRSDDVKDEE